MLDGVRNQFGDWAALVFRRLWAGLIDLAIVFAVSLLAPKADAQMGITFFPGPGAPPFASGAACVNGNLLLVYSDPCQLMSQMVGN